MKKRMFHKGMAAVLCGIADNRRGSSVYGSDGSCRRHCGRAGADA